MIEVPFNPRPDRETRIVVTVNDDSLEADVNETIVFSAVERYTIQAKRFAKAVLDDMPVPVPISDAIANMRVIEGILPTVRCCSVSELRPARKT